MSLETCFVSLNKGKPIFSEAEMKSLRVLARKSMAGTDLETAEKVAVQLALDEAIAERDEIFSLIAEAAGVKTKGGAKEVTAPSPVYNEAGEIISGGRTQEELKAQFNGAAARLMDKLTKGARASVVPEEDVDVMRELVAMIDAAIGLGHISLKQATKYVLDTLGLSDADLSADLLKKAHAVATKQRGVRAERGVKGAGEVSGKSLEEVPETLKPVVMDFMGWDENGDIDPEIEPMTFRALAAKYGEVSHETWKKRLAAIGFTEADRQAQIDAQTVEQATEEAAPDQIVEEGTEEVPGAFTQTGELIKDDEVVEREASEAGVKKQAISTETGLRWKTDLNKAINKWKEPHLAQASAEFLAQGEKSGVSPSLFAEINKELGRREAVRLEVEELKIAETTRAEKTAAAQALKDKESAENQEKQAQGVEKEFSKADRLLASRFWSMLAGTDFGSLTALQRVEYIRNIGRAADIRNETDMDAFTDNVHQSFIAKHNLGEKHGQDTKAKSVRGAEEAATIAEITEERQGTEERRPAARPVKVEVKKRRVAAAPEGEKLTETAGAKNPVPAEALISRLKALFRAAPLFDKIVTVYATQAEAVADGVLSENKGRVAGWQVGDKVGLIAENIEDGQELGIFLHEVGVHLGMEKLVGKANMNWLREKVVDWAKKNDGSDESLAAKAAIKRALKSTSANKEEEVIAYMVEELVNRGVQPRAAAKGTLSEWLGKFVNWTRIALLKMGLNAKFSGQNLVDLAYGAASMELTGKRGATKTYRNKEAFEAAERHVNDNYETLAVATLPDGQVMATRIPRGAKFSEVPQSATVAPDSPSRGVWEKAGAAFDRFFNDPLTMMKEHGLGWLSMDHLVEVAQGVNDKLSEYRDVSRKMQAMSKEWVYKAAKIDAEWGKLPEAAAKQLGDTMRAATRAGFDPEKGVAPVTTDEHKVQAMYAKLSPAAVKVYKAARDHYAAARTERQKIASSLLTSAYTDSIKKAEESGDAKKIALAEAELAKRLEQLDEKYRKVKGPYFPLMRLGKWYVVGMSKELAALEEKDTLSEPEKIRVAHMRKSERHYTTSSFETKSQAEAAQKALAKRYDDTRLNRAEEKSYAAGVLSAAGLQDVEEYINSSFDKEVASEIRTMMAELYYEALPEHHALKREMKREGVHGEEQDMRRVFAVSTIKSAHYMSRLKHADDLKSALFAIRREGKKSSDAMEYYNEVVKRAKLSMDETSAPWADKVAAVSYLAHLGMNPAFVLANASQVAMITAPWLAARTSVAKTTAALGSAYRVAGDLIVSSYKEQGWRAELDWEGKVPKGVADMLTTLLKRNLLDITIEHDLGATAELKHHALGDALKIGNLPVHITELANRAVTAIAAYNLAITELKMSQAEAEEFASKAVSTTQLDYSALNAPRHMQRVFGSAPAARIVMQFRKYQQGMLWLIGRSIYNALKSASPKEKAEARKTLFGLFTTTGVMAGSLGMPLAGTAMWGATAIASLFGDDDEPWDARTAYLNWLTEIVGKDAAIIIAKGLPAWMFGIDLEKRVGLGDIASPLPFMREGKTAREGAANALLAAAGAPVGTMVDMWDGVTMIGQGDWWKGSEKVFPLKGVQNLVRGARYGMEGMTEKDGDTILPPDAFSVADIGAKMVGFATTKESVYYEATSAVKGAQQAAMDVRKKLLADFSRARMSNESAADTLKKVREFNNRHPERGVRIDASSLASALRSRKLAARQRGETGLLKNKQAKPFLKEAAFAE